MKTHITTDSDKYSQGLSYAVNSDNMSYSVIDIGTCNDTDIIIPTKYENLPVTSIGNWAFRYPSFFKTYNVRFIGLVMLYN